MRKLILCLFVISLWSLMFAEQIQTATMDSTLVTNLRSAVTNGDPNYDEVMDFYYDMMNPGSTRYGEGDGDGWRENRAEYEPINKVSGYATKTFLGVIDVELAEEDTTYLNYAKRYLLDPDFPNTNPGEHYLDLNLVWNEFTSGWQNNHDFLLADLLSHCAFILDMLWYYLDDTERNDMVDIVDNMANFVNIVIEQPNITGRFYDLDELNDPDWDTRYPSSFSTDTNNHRIYFTAALGYAGCVQI